MIRLRYKMTVISQVILSFIEEGFLIFAMNWRQLAQAFTFPSTKPPHQQAFRHYPLSPKPPIHAPLLNPYTPFTPAPTPPIPLHSLSSPFPPLPLNPKFLHPPTPITPLAPHSHQPTPPPCSD
jgi:hypothetical protein